MRILGIDPGLHLTGYGCVEIRTANPEPQLCEAGVIRLNRKAPLEDRLEQLHRELVEVITDLQPQRLVVEGIFSHVKRAQTAILMGHARGVVLLAARQHELVLGELTATEVKKAIAGNGHASKEQMQHAVMLQCGLPEPPSPPDVADAIAIALCAGRRLVAERLVSDCSPG